MSAKRIGLAAQVADLQCKMGALLEMQNARLMRRTATAGKAKQFRPANGQFFLMRFGRSVVLGVKVTARWSISGVGGKTIDKE